MRDTLPSSFKQINDQYGHRVGDLYLREAAARMKHQLRSQDILARLGGDEFAVLVSKINSHSEAEEIAYRLDRCFDQPFAIEGWILNGSASVGLAMFPQDGTTKDSLLTAADTAMYIAKKAKSHVKSFVVGPSVARSHAVSHSAVAGERNFSRNSCDVL